MAILKLGQILTTPGARDALIAAEQDPRELLMRHREGDWGDVTKNDASLNDQSAKNGSRVLSAYNLTTGVRVWIITEGDRSATTILLPEEN